MNDKPMSKTKSPASAHDFMCLSEMLLKVAIDLSGGQPGREQDDRINNLLANVETLAARMMRFRAWPLRDDWKSIKPID